MNLENFSIKRIHQGLRNKEFSAQEVLDYFFKKIAEKEDRVKAFLEISREFAQKEAQIVDEKIAKGEPIDILEGIPYAVKDNILVRGFKCTAGSKILQHYQAVFDATCVRKLKKRGGRVIVGKTNLDEFAMGSSTENSAFFPTRNPFDPERVPGGSSGGSAAAVGAGEVVFALGSDTGGSIRQPSSFCGVVGLKPTYGSVSRYGLIAFASSLDQVGPITRFVQDAEIIFDIIKGKDPQDATSYYPQLDEQQTSLKNVKIGLPREYFTSKGFDERIKKQIEKIVMTLEKEGFKFEEVSLPHTEYALPCYVIVATCEASANLARYDGIRYGIKNPTFKNNSLNDVSKNLIDEYLTIRGEGFGEEVKRRIMLGTFALSSGYYDAYYLRAQKVRTLIKQDFEKAFEKVDFLFTPTSPTLPFKIGEKSNDPLQMYLSDILTVPVNLAGLPALNICVGFIDNLPVGMQIISKPFAEKQIFEIGKFIEKIIS